MYNYLKGILEYKSNEYIVIECNGVGYEVFATTETINNLCEVGQECKVFTFLNVKEDGMYLYGFSSMQEKSMFLQLTSISGIGPKMGLTVLSSININDLSMSILSGDASLLYKVKGVGKKTADRIVLELKDKIESNYTFDTINDKSSPSSEHMNDAIAALVSLGVNRVEAVKLVRSYAKTGDTAEEIITKCLKKA